MVSGFSFWLAHLVMDLRNSPHYNYSQATLKQHARQSNLFYLHFLSILYPITYKPRNPTSNSACRISLCVVPPDLSFTFTHTSLVTQNSLYQTFTHLQQLYI